MKFQMVTRISIDSFQVIRDLSANNLKLINLVNSSDHVQLAGTLEFTQILVFLI